MRTLRDQKAILEKERDGLPDDDDGASRSIEIEYEIKELASAITAANNKAQLQRAEATKKRKEKEGN